MLLQYNYADHLTLCHHHYHFLPSSPIIAIMQIQGAHQLVELSALELQPRRILHQRSLHDLHRGPVLRTQLAPRVADVLQVRPDVVEDLVHLLDSGGWAGHGDVLGFFCLAWSGLGNAGNRWVVDWLVELVFYV